MSLSRLGGHLPMFPNVLKYYYIGVMMMASTSE
jgi:hypothetical protein